MKNENSNKQDYFVIDFVHIFKSVWHRIWVVILAALIAGVGGFSYAKFCIDPTYSSSLMLYVNNESSITGGKFSFNASELDAAQELIETYKVMLMNRTTLTAIMKDAKVDKKYTYEEFYYMIKAEAVNETEVLQVTVTSKDYKEAARIADSIGNEFPDILSEIMHGCTMEVVDHPVENSNRVAPYITKYTAVAMVMGAVFSLAVLVVLALMDGTIHDESYLLKNYDYPILAKVPNLLGTSEKQYAYYYQKRKTNKE